MTTLAGPDDFRDWLIGAALRGLVFFMENLLAPFSLQALARPLGPATKLQMVAVDDIGWLGARPPTPPT